MRKTVYLGGPINGCTDEEASGWRELVKPKLEEMGLDWIDPMSRDYRGREMEPGIAREIVEGDKEDIFYCEILLMNCPRPSVGTSMEIYHGWTKGKHIVCVIPEGHTPSPWLVYHADEIVEGSILNALEKL